MIKIDESMKSEYFKKSFLSIDGLWFMKLEEVSSFEDALEIDRKVWEIIPRIQARSLKSLLKIEGNGLEALSEALSAKAYMEDCIAEFVIENGGSLVVKILDCPWLKLMEKSGRAHLAGKVGETICGTEYPVWMREFGINGVFSLETMLCKGNSHCKMVFKEKIE